MDRILPLTQAQPLTLVGGKAYSLFQLINLGANVPAGFVVSVSNKMSPSTKADALKAFDDFGFEKVAVRSSGIGEDSEEAAWAGQLDTFLNVSRKNLIRKIELCLSSFQSDRAKSYAHQRNLSVGRVAVIVQKMINPQISGVAFTANPVTSATDQIVVECAEGLGEALVSGTVTPSTYIIEKNAAKVVEKHEKNIKMPDQVMERVVDQSLKIEGFFGFPVDIEWAYASGDLFILQTRPITTLK
jgi:phosphoenolpyruvate synthase/pyruvate phosphate dikinase